MANFSVVAGNIGTVYSGDDAAVALETFEAYAELSFLQLGRAAGEDVTVFENGEIAAEHHILDDSKDQE